MADPITLEAGPNSTAPTSGTIDLPTPRYTKKLEELLKEMKGKSLVMLIEDGIAYEIRLSLKNKRLVVEFKQMSEDRVLKYTNDTIAVLNRTGKVWLGTMTAIGHTAVAAAPTMQLFNVSQKVVQGCWQGANAAIETAKKVLEDRDAGERTSHDHCSSVYRDSKSESSQFLQQNGQFYREMDGVLDKMKSAIQDLIRSLYAGG